MRHELSPTATLFHADCRDAIRALPDNSLDSCVTDPPYALVSIVKRFGSPNAAPAKGNDAYMRASAGFMGKTWDTGEVAMAPEFWAEVYRVLKPGAFVAAFGASRGYHRMACAIEDAGFEIRDSLMWIYGTGFPKSHSVDKGIDAHFGAEREVVGQRNKTQSYGANEVYGDGPDKGGLQLITAPATPEAAEWEGWGTALKPAFEPIVLARKPLSEKTVAANVLKWRTGALNIDGCRVGLAEGETPYSYPNGAGGSDPNHMWRGREKGDGQETKTGNDKGRWPANVVTDGSDEVIGMFPDSKGGGTPHARGGQGFHNCLGRSDRERKDGAAVSGIADSGSAARFFYSAKASKADRNGSKHPTVKPIALMEWLATLITPPGGTILDPFAGSGTTGAAARNKGFKVILCEREAEYVEDIQRRLVDIQRIALVPPPPIYPAIIPPPPY